MLAGQRARGYASGAMPYHGVGNYLSCMHQQSLVIHKSTPFCNTMIRLFVVPTASCANCQGADV